MWRRDSRRYAGTGVGRGLIEVLLLVWSAVIHVETSHADNDLVNELVFEQSPLIPLKQPHIRMLGRILFLGYLRWSWTGLPLWLAVN